MKLAKRTAVAETGSAWATWWLAALAISVAASVGVFAICVIKLTALGETAPAIIILSLTEVATGFLIFEGLRRRTVNRPHRVTAWEYREAATAVLGFGIAAALMIGIVYADLGMMVVAVLAGLGPRYSLQHAADRVQAIARR